MTFFSNLKQEKRRKGKHLPLFFPFANQMGKSKENYLFLFIILIAAKGKELFAVLFSASAHTLIPFDGG